VLDCLAMSGKENTEYDSNPADVNVAMFVEILLVIECVTVLITGTSS